VYAALTYGRIIISEHCLPHHAKTIQPTYVGGVAGGEVPHIIHVTSKLILISRNTLCAAFCSSLLSTDIISMGVMNTL
jgi:hypothetical protein